MAKYSILAYLNEIFRQKVGLGYQSGMKFYEEHCEPKNFHLALIDREILAKNSQKWQNIRF